MIEGENQQGQVDLRWIAAAATTVSLVVAAFALVYLLRDIFILLFVGIVVAAAIQPWHMVLCRWGLPKGMAVLLIYLLLLFGLGGIALLVGPVLLDQIATFMTEAPGAYESLRSYLLSNSATPLHLLGQRMPPFDQVIQVTTDFAPHFFEGALSLTTVIVSLPAYLVTVLAIAFYWTVEVPRFERLVLSLLPVEQRTRTLSAWHEIEFKLGGFIRGQGLAMLSIGVGSAAGYLLIGLPNVLALAVLAGLLEVVPMIGPMLAVVPAVLVALPLGQDTVLLVIALAIFLQIFENNILIPLIMNRAVGVSSLVGLMAVLAFGTLYGILGVLLAIPIAAVVQVLFDTMVVNADPVSVPDGIVDAPLAEVHSRVHNLRQQARSRLRARTSRMGIDPSTNDHVVDAADQQIEEALGRIEEILAAAESTTEPLAAEAMSGIVERLQNAMTEIESSIGQVETTDTGDGTQPASNSVKESEQAITSRAALRDTNSDSRGVLSLKIDSVEAAESTRDIDAIDQAAQRFTATVNDVGRLVHSAQEDSKEMTASRA